MRAPYELCSLCVVIPNRDVGVNNLQHGDFGFVGIEQEITDYGTGSIAADEQRAGARFTISEDGRHFVPIGTVGDILECFAILSRL